MRFFRTQMWSYAVLLIILFAIAAIAVWNTISYLEEQHVADFYIISLLLWIITLGFMFIAGAFGLWAIKFSAESESRRRIGLLVDSMDYITDGLLAVNEKGTIEGSNPAAKRLAGAPLNKHEWIGEAFPSLTSEDAASLLNSGEPNEVERDVPSDDKALTLRFRSQPSEGLNLIMISDVTATNTKRQRARQAAKLQLVGQLARGVANDFNNLLWTISGHTSILQRVKPDSPDARKSIAEILDATQRGISLASHLGELGRARIAGRSTPMAEEHIRNAELLLKDVLPVGWTVECRCLDKLPAVGISGIEIEQAVLNLGLIASDQHPAGGILRVLVGRPSKEQHFLNVDPKYAAVAAIFPGLPAAPDAAETTDHILEHPVHETGIIVSVVRSMIEDTGGAVEELKTADGRPIFRLLLPHGDVRIDKASNEAITDEIRQYVAGWKILACFSQGSHYDKIVEELHVSGVTFHRTESVAGALAYIEETEALDVILIAKTVLGGDSRALLKAIRKICPGSGIVVVCEDPAHDAADMGEDMVAVDTLAGVGDILRALIESRNRIMKPLKA